MAEYAKAHKINQKPRTSDVKINETVDFDSLLLSDEVLTGLKKCGFEKPSPIQLKAIPLGRCGLDLIVQAKSGTGKTCVFAVVALESIMLDTNSVQVLVLTPTREIAIQVWEVINSIASQMSKLRCYTFIGGMPVAEDKVKLKKCHIAVGTPGRIKQLIEEHALNTESVRLFVLDEADKLMEQGFQETINWIYSSLAENKQMLALSATYPEILAQHLTAYMRNPTYVRLNTDDLSLLGIRQYYKTVPFSPLPQKIFESKCAALMELLSDVSFQQCLVFSNYQLRAQSLSDVLNNEGWPSTYISGSQDQKDRIVAMAKLKTFKCRVLISTDLTSRGIDAENVNLVVNLDIPHDKETYLHRIGRAGRYGTYGAAVTFACLGKEMADLRTIESKANTRINQLPDDVPADLAHSSGYIDYSSLVSTEIVTTENHQSPSTASHLHTGSGDQLSTNQEQLVINGSQSERSDVFELNDEESVKLEELQDEDKMADTGHTIDQLIDDLQSSVQSEYSQVDKLLEDSVDFQPSQITTAGVDMCDDNEANGSKIVVKEENIQIPGVTKLEPDHSEGQSEKAHSEETKVLKSDVSEDKDVDCDEGMMLPSVESLQQFSDCVKARDGLSTGVVLPTLSDVSGMKKHRYVSYDEMITDFKKHRCTGESSLNSQIEYTPPNPAAFDSAVKILADNIKNLKVTSIQEGANKDEVNCDRVKSTGFQNILDKTSYSENVQVTCDVGNFLSENNVNKVVDNDVTSPKQVSKDDDSSPCEWEVNRIIGFNELSSHLGKPYPQQQVHSGARPKTQLIPESSSDTTGSRKLKKSQRKIVTRKNQTDEDNKILVHYMQKLIARKDSDSESSSTPTEEEGSEPEEDLSTYSDDYFAEDVVEEKARKKKKVPTATLR